MYSLFYRLPRLTILTFMVIVLAGLAAIMSLGRQEDPSLIERFGYVLVTMPGADAERMEALITEPVEAALMELPELDEVVSTSRPGVSQIQIQIREDLTESEVDDAWTLIAAQAEQAQNRFPAEASAPFVSRQVLGAATIIVALSWEGEGDVPLAVMRRRALDLEDRFQRLAGTEEVKTYGLPDEEVRVEMDPEGLSATGLSMREAAGLIASADSKIPAGQLRTLDGNIGFEVDGAFDSIARIMEVPLLQRGDGSAVRVGDISRVTKGFTDPPTNMAMENGRRTILVVAFISSNQRVDKWAQTAQSLVDEFDAEVTGPMRVETVFDQSKYTNERLNGLALNLLMSAGIVFLVLFLTMGWRSALVVGTAIPLTVCLVLILFNVFGHPLHQMSVTGLVISLGLLIDNAIVVVDEFDQLRVKGRTRRQAIEQSLRHLMAPLAASTLTTALAFAPIALMPGSAGEFIGMIGLSVVFAICASFVLSVTVIPALAGWFDRQRGWESGRARRERRWWRDGIRFDWLSDGYRATVGGVLKYPVIGIVMCLIPAGLGIVALGQLPQQFFPQTERDQFQVSLQLAPSASLADTQEVTGRATELLRKIEGVETVTWVLGESTPPVYYNMVDRTEGVEGIASGWVQLDSPQRTRSIIDQVQSQLRTEFPEARFLALPFEQGPPANAPIELRIYGDNFETLDYLGNHMRTLLSKTPGVTYTTASMRLGAPTITLKADEAASALAGRRLSGLAADLNAELEGVLAGSVLESTVELPVRVIAPLADRSTLEAIKGYDVGGAMGGTPLSALGEVTLVPKTAIITRKEGQRVNIILAFLDPYTLPAPSLAKFQEALAESDLIVPPGYDVTIGGEAENSSEAVGNLASLGIPLVFVMAGAVMLVFNSFRMMLLVLTTGGLSILMAFLGVWLFNLPFGFNAILGGLGLLGISINGSIVVLSLLSASDEARSGDIIAQREIVVDATRHIVATTLTTMGGFVPILLSGDSFWMPLAAGIAGGVAGSALLALYFTPAVFRLIAKKPVSRRASKGHDEALAHAE